MKRRLTLKSEHLTELTNPELTAVAGGATFGCLTGYYLTINAPCPTVQECIYIGPVLSVQRECPTYGCFTGTSAHTIACS